MTDYDLPKKLNDAPKKSNDNSKEDKPKTNAPKKLSDEEELFKKMEK